MEGSSASAVFSASTAMSASLSRRRRSAAKVKVVTTEAPQQDEDAIRVMIARAELDVFERCEREMTEMAEREAAATVRQQHAEAVADTLRERLAEKNRRIAELQVLCEQMTEAFVLPKAKAALIPQRQNPAARFGSRIAAAQTYSGQ